MKAKEPKNASDYDYTAALSASRWAWEFLRRNPDFRADASKYMLDGVKASPACHDITLIALDKDQHVAERWGLAFIPDLEATGADADVFWSGGLYERRVQTHITPRHHSQPCEIYDKIVATCKISHLTDRAGREHMLVKGNGCVIQVTTTGLSVLANEPIKMNYVIDSLSAFQDKLKTLERAQRVYGPDGSIEAPDWTRQSLAYRNALIALDCHHAGYSYLETARFIYGVERANEAWASESRAMKDEMRRALIRGKRLSADGYKTLLGPKASNTNHQAGVEAPVHPTLSYGPPRPPADLHDEDYAYTLRLTRSQWAWEFLRRNKIFMAEAISDDRKSLSQISGCRGITLLKLRAPCPSAGRWGVAYYPDPFASAADANVFWNTERASDAIRVQVTPRAAAEVDDIFERCLAVCNIVHLTDADGREHLLLKGAKRTLQVECSGLSLLSAEPVRMHIAIDTMERFGTCAATIEHAYRLFEAPESFTPSERSIELMRTLIILDANRLGFSRKEIAARWCDGDQDRARLRLRHGQHMMTGGYLDLLRAKSLIAA